MKLTPLAWIGLHRSQTQGQHQLKWGGEFGGPPVRGVAKIAAETVGYFDSLYDIEGIQSGFCHEDKPLCNAAGNAQDPRDPRLNQVGVVDRVEIGIAGG